ncbi:MAG: hypothetical protein II628_06565 [Lachnospiraceae bacterium]|nr:hypothetical protein [Lachnospiraceae bacterium]
MDQNDNMQEMNRKKRAARAKAEEYSRERMRQHNGRILESTEMGKYRKTFLDQVQVIRELPRSYSEEREKELSGLLFEGLLREVQELTSEEKGWQDPEEYFWQKLLKEVPYVPTGVFSLAVTGLIILVFYAFGFSLEGATDGVGTVFAWTAALICTLAACAAGCAAGCGLGRVVRECADPDKRDLWILFPPAGALLPGFFVWPRVWHFMTRPLSRSLYLAADAAWAVIIFLFVLILTVSLNLPRHLFHLACRNHMGLRILEEELYTDMLQGPEGQDLMIIAADFERILAETSSNTWEASLSSDLYRSFMEEYGAP